MCPQRSSQPAHCAGCSPSAAITHCFKLRRCAQPWILKTPGRRAKAALPLPSGSHRGRRPSPR
eukprot:4367517-Pyramimonas_sp.AAC.1